MKFFTGVVCLLLVLGFHAHQGIAASPEVNGFADMAWGSSLQANQQTKNLILSREKDGKGGSLYTLKDVSMDFGRATLTAIECSFVENRLHGVMLLFAGEQNFNGVRAEAKKRYGKPIFVSQKGSSMLTWPSKNSSIVLSYNLQSQSGFLYLKAKKLPPMATVAQVAPQQNAPPPTAVQPPAAVDELALFDQASGVQQPADTASPLSPFQGGNEPTTTELINPEVQGYIDRDQALTRLCWDTVGQIADQACAEMQNNQQRLKELGWCVRPGEAPDGLQVSWVRCQVVETTSGATSAAVSPGSATPPSPEASICSLVVELFAATADLREKEVTPVAAEEALLQRQKNRSAQLPIELIRETVELVYFDHRYNSLPLLELTTKVEQQCRTKQGPYIAPLPRQ